MGKKGGKFNSNGNRSNGNNGNKTVCYNCGSDYHTANKCNSSKEDIDLYKRYRSKGFHDNCRYCGKSNHLAVNCRSKKQQKNKGSGQNNDSNNTPNKNNNKGQYCDFCKFSAGHKWSECYKMQEWQGKMEENIVKEINKLPYCAVCHVREGNNDSHHWLYCQSGLEKPKLEKWTLQIRSVLLQWIEKPGDGTSYMNLLDRDPLYCGRCEGFGDHGTLYCPHGNIQEQSYSHGEGGRLDTAIIDKKNDSKGDAAAYDPIVEKRCRMCRWQLPRTIALKGQPNHSIIVSCINCGRNNLLDVESEEEEQKDHRWGRDGSGVGVTSKSKAMHFADYSKALSTSYLDTYHISEDSKGQPYYEGRKIRTVAAAHGRAHYKPQGDGGWWHFNDPGNFQPCFPPKLIHFTAEDEAVRNEPAVPINRARSGLRPFCARCGTTGLVADKDNDVVMIQSGSDMEGNIAGAGAGSIAWENPRFIKGRDNGEHAVLGRCSCWLWGWDPMVVWD